jgi:RNA polymerase sigma-70 factor, ECF subfamily
MRNLDLESASDDALIGAFVRRGDQAAVSVLLRRHESRVLGLAYRMLGNRPDALDATQEVFLTVFRKASSFGHRSSFTTWLYRLTINACYDLGRKKARTPEPHPQPLAEVRDAGHSIDARLDVQRALSKLAPDQRAAVVMRDLYQMSYQEIAEVEGVPVGTIKSRIARARVHLAEILAPAPGVEPR